MARNSADMVKNLIAMLSNLFASGCGSRKQSLEGGGRARQYALRQSLVRSRQPRHRDGPGKNAGKEPWPGGRMQAMRSRESDTGLQGSPSTTLLETIDDPAQVRGLNRSQLQQLADELRAFVIESVSKTGGHLSSNLGTV